MVLCVLEQLGVIFSLRYFESQSCLFLSVGESGLGKSTLINSLFLTDLYKDRTVPNAQGEISSVIYSCVAHVNERMVPV